MRYVVKLLEIMAIHWGITTAEAPKFHSAVNNCTAFLPALRGMAGQC